MIMKKKKNLHNKQVLKNQSLKRQKHKLKKCKDYSHLLGLANSYGFNITTEDLEQDTIAQRADDWFNTSKISPLRKNNY